MINMLKGENRHICVKITSSDSEVFTINKAEFEIYKTDTVIKLYTKGECTVEDHVIRHMFAPDCEGVYMIRYILQIADETVVQKIYATVDK